MEDRQRQIQVGAGLQESRLNTDLIQFLQKYGTPILMVVLVVVLGYTAWNRYNRWQDDRRDEAFAAYQAARVGFGPDGVLTGSPDNLLRVAEEMKGRGSVWELATLDAADISLAAARRGIAPGIEPGGGAPKPEDMLSDPQKTELVRKADRAYRSVLDAVARDDAKFPLALCARWGLAATATSLGEADRARSVLNEIITSGEKKELPAQVAIAKKRLELLPSFLSPPRLYANAELPASARVPEPAAAPEGVSITPVPNPTEPQIIVPEPVPAPTESQSQPESTPESPASATPQE